MLLHDLFSILLIPSIIPQNDNSSSNFNEEFDNFQVPQFPEIFERQRRSEDPLLAKVEEEVKRLQLDFPDDYFDHLEDQSEEVRALIEARQKSLEDAKTSTTTPTPTTVSSSISDEYTQFPIWTTPSTPLETTTKKSGFFGSAFNSVKKGAETVASPFVSVGKSLFGGKKATPPTAIFLTTKSPEHNCTSKQIFFKGECANLLQSLHCPPSQWLVEDPDTLQAKCVHNPCHENNTMALFGGECIQVGKGSHCHIGMRTYIYRSGVVECDCKEGFIYNKNDGNCYEAFKRGPCANEQYFIIPKSGRSKPDPECLPNSCKLDGTFCNAPRCPNKRNCKQLGSACGKDNKAQYVIDPFKFIPYCNEGEIVLKIIGNVPTLSCAPGSRRDILGNCRTPTKVDFS